MSANLSLAGFSGDLCAFMTCKELIENAVDATCDVPDGGIRLDVDARESNWLVSCEDNGRGFEVDSVEALCNVFSSSKRNAGRASTGKFGVGLKAMVLMCSEACKQDVVITSAIRGSGSAVKFRLSCDPLGEVVMSEPHLIERSSSGWTTQVLVHCPVPPSLEEFVESVSVYISELCTSFKTPQFGVEFILDGKSIVKFPTNEPVSFVSHHDASGLIRCTANLSFGEITRRITIVRFVNGVPLITPSSMACNLLQGALGVVCKLSPSLGIELGKGSVAESSTTDMVRSHVSVASGPPDSSWTSLNIRVNIVQQQSRNIEYNCLSKDAVVGVKNTSASLPIVVARCVRACLKKAQAKFRSEFQSHEDFEYKCAVAKHIPCIAHSLSALCERIITSSSSSASGSLRNQIGEVEGMEVKFKKALTDALFKGHPPL